MTKSNKLLSFLKYTHWFYENKNGTLILIIDIILTKSIYFDTRRTLIITDLSSRLSVLSVHRKYDTVQWTIGNIMLSKNYIFVHSIISTLSSQFVIHLSKSYL